MYQAMPNMWLHLVSKLKTLTLEGGYSPQIRIFDLSQLSLKCERHIEVEVVNFKILSEDYQKLVLLRSDRSLEFHAQFGRYYNIRVPRVRLLITTKRCVLVGQRHIV